MSKRCVEWVKKPDLKAGQGGARCLGPRDEGGRHVDGNPNCYNGPSHYTKDGQFVRGTGA